MPYARRVQRPRRRPTQLRYRSRRAYTRPVRRVVRRIPIRRRRAVRRR